MSKIRNAMHRFVRNEEGATAVEYAVMLGLILLVCMVSIQALASATGDSFDASTTAITTATSN
ncbi:MAG: Flp family type IVb pilin [Planctomycetota bacterium]